MILITDVLQEASVEVKVGKSDLDSGLKGNPLPRRCVLDGRSRQNIGVLSFSLPVSII